MRYDSPHWNRAIGVCEKHLLPSVPCPACLEDMEDVVTIRETWDLDDLIDSDWKAEAEQSAADLADELATQRDAIE